MAYTTPAEIKATVRNLSQNITDQEIQVFCDKATVYLDARLGSLYAVPFSPVPAMINLVATELAGYYITTWLYSSQKPNQDEKTADKWESIQKLIEKILAGDIDLGIPTLNGRSSGFATTNDREAIFDYDTEW